MMDVNYWIKIIADELKGYGQPAEREKRARKAFNQYSVNMSPEERVSVEDALPGIIEGATKMRQREGEPQEYSPEASKEAAENMVYALIYSINEYDFEDSMKITILNKFMDSLVKNNVIPKYLKNEVWGYGHLKIKTGLTHPSRY